MDADKARLEIQNLINALRAPDGKVFLSLLARRAETLEALELSLSSLKMLCGKPLLRGPGSTKRGTAWQEEEELRLEAEFDSGKGIEELADIFNRSPSSIVSRLAKLGRSPE